MESSLLARIVSSGISLTVFFLAGCASSEPLSKMRIGQPGIQGDARAISSYEECVAAGNITTRSLPPRCITSAGHSFTKGVGLRGTAVPGTPLESPSNKLAVTSFDGCVAAGNAIRRTLPATCVTAEGTVFTEGRGSSFHDQIEDLGLEGRGHELKGRSAGSSEGACRNLCGDEECQEIVCMAVGCPCPENSATCPADCK